MCPECKGKKVIQLLTSVVPCICAVDALLCESSGGEVAGESDLAKAIEKGPASPSVLIYQDGKYYLNMLPLPDETPSDDELKRGVMSAARAEFEDRRYWVPFPENAGGTFGASAWVIDRSLTVANIQEWVNAARGDHLCRVVSLSFFTEGMQITCEYLGPLNSYEFWVRDRITGPSPRVRFLQEENRVSKDFGLQGPAHAREGDLG